MEPYDHSTRHLLAQERFGQLQRDGGSGHGDRRRRRGFRDLLHGLGAGAYRRARSAAPARG